MPKENFKKKVGAFNLSVSYDKADEAPVELMIYQDIGDDPFSEKPGFTAKDFQDALKDVPKTRALDIRVNSAGGNVWDGLAIRTLINEWPGKKTASIDGMAASVASWMCCNKDIEVRAPKHAQMFIHNAWGIVAGDHNEMRAQANDLEKTSAQIADIYSGKTGRPVSEWLGLMGNNSLFTAEEANKLGLIDRLTDDEPVANFSALQIRNMKSRLALLNSYKQPEPTNKNSMNRKQKIAALNKWGVSTSANATDEWVNSRFDALSPLNKPVFKNGKDGDHDESCDCANCAAKNAPKPSAEKPASDAPGAEEDDEDELFKAATDNEQANNRLAKQVNSLLQRERKKALTAQFDKLVQDGKIPANEVFNKGGWLEAALEAKDDGAGENPIVNRLSKLPAVIPGREPLNIDIGESDSVVDLDRNVTKLLEAQTYYSRNAHGPENRSEREHIGRSSKQVSYLINRLKKFDSAKSENGLRTLTGPIREMWDRFVASPRNANTMSTALLRQVILSEVMRAFRREFTSLTYFSHNFGNVPLEGTDVVNVPYYPLATTASTEFTYAAGYTTAANAVTNSKTITVGGIGNGVATPGSGRKYQSLQFKAYEIRRQPWLDIQKLSVMAGEQLAIDVRADIIGTQICAANFGNAIWTGGPGGFDHTVVGNVLMLAAINAFWPRSGRNIVLAPGYFSNLAIDPGLYPYLYSGNTDILNSGLIQNKYTFENILYDALLPVTTSIQGGSNNQVNGLDPYLAGYMAWPSAVLIATAPIMPPPGVLKKLVAYEQVTDDQTNLAFTYQFWGNESANVDNEIIECTYGSGLGELKALFRLTSQGN